MFCQHSKIRYATSGHSAGEKTTCSFTYVAKPAPSVNSTSPTLASLTYVRFVGFPALGRRFWTYVYVTVASLLSLVRRQDDQDGDLGVNA